MEQVPLAIGWLLYAALHSLLADLRVKAVVAACLPGFAPWYRLAYNGVAVLTALPLIWLMRAVPGAELWAWNGVWAWLANGLALAALFGAMQSSKAYAMNDFLGLGVLGADKAIERDVFSLSPPHRFDSLVGETCSASRRRTASCAIPGTALVWSSCGPAT